MCFSVAMKSPDWAENSPVVWWPLPSPPVFHKPSKPLDLSLQLPFTQSYFIISPSCPSQFCFFAALAFHQRIEPSGFNTLMNVKRDAAFCLILKKQPLIQERDQFTLASSSSLSVGILALEKCPPSPRPAYLCCHFTAARSSVSIGWGINVRQKHNSTPN